MLPLERYSARLRALLPEAELTVLPKVGHIAMWDDPDLVASTILDFTARRSAREPTPL